MTSRIVQAHLDLLNKLKSIPPLTGSKDKKLFRYYNIWDESQDDAVLNKKENESYSFDFPAIFIEFIPGDCKMLGQGVSSYPDTEIIFHIYHMKINSGNDMEKNIDSFYYRDAIKTVLTGANITGCSSLMGCFDKLDYKHGNVYKYLVGFKTNYIDTKGSIFDVDSGAEYAVLANPTLTIPLFQMFGVDVYYNEIQNSFYINE